MKKIVVCGLGYVGLVHLLGCWERANQLDLDYKFIGVDPDVKKVESIKSGECPIVEKGLNELLERALESPKIEFASSHEVWWDDPEVEMLFCCVGTPMSDNGAAYMGYVDSVARMFGSHIKNLNAVFVNKSTSPAGTCKRLYNIILEELDKRYAEGVRYSEISVLSNPEFLREGSALEDMMNPDRIIIGGQSEDEALRLRKFYDDLGFIYGTPTHCIITSWENAELIKYASNAMLATRISFINDLADLCENVGANINEVAEGMGLDHRIGSAFLKPGPGYGGSCFPKDTRALLYQGLINGVEMRVVDAVIKSNEYHRHKASDIISSIIEKYDVRKIGVVGMAFKPGTGDLRESPSIDLVKYLMGTGKEILVFDHHVNDEEMEKYLPGCKDSISILSSDNLKDCDVLIIMHPVSISFPDDNNIKVILDMRGSLREEDVPKLKDLDIKYIGHGRGDVNKWINQK